MRYTSCSLHHQCSSKHAIPDYKYTHFQTLVTPPAPSVSNALLASLHHVVNGIVALLRDLRLEVEVHELALLGRPLSIGISVEDDLIATCITDLGCCVAEHTICGPLDLVACGLGDEEGLAAALRAFLVDAGLEGVVGDAA